MSNTKNERLKQILENIKIKHTVTTGELAESFSMSEMTIRRDVLKLAKRNLVKIIHGAIIYNKNSIDSQILSANTYTLKNASTSFLEEKKLISKKALTLIEDNDVIIIDNGSTTEYLAEILPLKNNITVVCFALNILQKVHELGIKNIIFPGGYYRSDVMCFESFESIKFLLKHRANKAFISTSAVSIDHGLTTSSYYGAKIKRAAIGISSKKILLCDSSKFDKVQAANFAELNDFDTCITDKNIPKNYIDTFKSFDVEVIKV